MDVAHTPAPELCRIDAAPLARMIRERQVSAVEVMTAYLDHIAAANPAVNALISLRPRAELLAEAQAADAAVASGDIAGPLHGVPQAIKDLAPTKGLRTTFGSPLTAEFVPEADAIFVARMRAAGAIIIGKTNVPEFGYGSNSYNPIFGVTRNPWDATKVGGGSSGGAGVALAMRMLPVADGGDMMGSLRNPGAFNNVIGFRPSQGRVPNDSLEPFYSQMAVIGALGRTVEDVAMLLGVQAGYHPADPLSLDGTFDWAQAARPASPKGLRFGWLGDYGGHLPFEDGVLDLNRKAAGLLEAAGAELVEIDIDFDMPKLWDAWVKLRQQAIGGRHQLDYADPERRKLLKPEAIWEVEGSRTRTPLDVFNAGLVRAAWHRRMLALFKQVDFLLLPAAQVFPFDADLHWPAEVGGRKMDTYHRWMEVVIGPTLAGLPAVSVPAGFGPAGLPTGMQIVGPPRRDDLLLGAAALYMELCPWKDRLPPAIA